MLYCEAGHRDDVIQALEPKGLKCMDFRFERMGARVLMNAGLTMPRQCARPA